MKNWLIRNMRRLGRSFYPELYYDLSIFPYLLQKKSLEDAVEFVRRHMSGAQSFKTRQGLFKYTFERANAEGLIIECGVAGGESILYLANLTERPIDGFDSFEGLPDDGILPSTPDGGSQWYVGKIDFGGKIPNAPKNVKFYKGLFEDTLPKYFSEKSDKETIALLHIDCDLYSSTKTVFENCRNYITENTIIVFDEYFGFRDWRANEHRALVEFSEETKMSYEFIGYNFKGGAAIRVLGFGKGQPLL